MPRVNCTIAIGQPDCPHAIAFVDTYTITYLFFLVLHSLNTSCIDPLQLLKIKKSTARNELSYETEHKSDEAESFGETIARRIQVTAEVAVSKIFPAGELGQC